MSRVLGSFFEQHRLHLVDDRFLFLHDFRQSFVLFVSVVGESGCFEVVRVGVGGDWQLEGFGLSLHDVEIRGFQLKGGDLGLKVSGEVGHGGRARLEELEFW